MRSSVFFIAGILLLSSARAQAQIPWNDNLRTAHAQAQAEGKLLLLHFYTDNCHWCDKLEEGAFQSPELANAIGQAYIPVKIHAGENPTLAKTFRVSRFPTDVIVTTEGAVLAHSVSPQAPKDYVGMLAKYSGPPVSPPAGNPAGPIGANTAIAQAGAVSNPQLAPNQTTPPATSFGLPAGPQANPYAPQEGAGSNLAAGAGYANPAPVHSAPQANPYGGPSGASLGMPTANNAFANNDFANPTPAQPTAGFALPPGLAGTPSTPVGHRTDDLAFNAPGNSDVAAEMGMESSASNASPETEPPALAMQGYCPVAVVDNDKWLAGKSDLGLIHLGKLYLFSTKEAQETFRADPEKYTPVLNGLDVVLFFEEHRLVEGSREWGLKDPEFNRMFFFSNEETFNHFYQDHQRYTRSAIEVTRQATRDANPSMR